MIKTPYCSEVKCGASYSDKQGIGTMSVFCKHCEHGSIIPIPNNHMATIEKEEEMTYIQFREMTGDERRGA